jgi:hypothetical protein
LSADIANQTLCPLFRRVVRKLDILLPPNLVIPVLWVHALLLEHLVAERNLSRNTQASYRDTLTLLLPFAASREATPSIA